MEGLVGLLIGRNQQFLGEVVTFTIPDIHIKAHKGSLYVAESVLVVPDLGENVSLHQKAENFVVIRTKFFD